MNHQAAMTSYIAAFVAELVKNGVENAVVSPGSRSTPMAMVMAEHPDLNIHIHVDERSAAFFALGMAKASKQPVVLLCTSGTAAANYFPAIVEAFYSRVPLIVLTADRPHELRDVGAPQAIDQIRLYGHHVKWFVEMAPPENSIEMIRYARTVCARAAAAAKRAPSGPVHLNFPFREPLIPLLDNEELFKSHDREDKYVKVQTGEYHLQEHEFEQIAETISSAAKGVIVCGPLEEDGFTEEVIKLAQKLKFPILADPLSQLRSGNHDGAFIIDTYDTILKNSKALRELKPDLVIRFGAMPVSKPLSIFLKEHANVRQMIIDGGAGWRDQGLVSTDMIYCHETVFCQSLLPIVEEKGNDTYYSLWRSLNEITRECLQQIEQNVSLSEGKLFSQLSKLLPENALLFIGNSMPIRDLDTFFHYNQKSFKIMANRGANGIDGIVSTALGAASITQPAYLIVGDLTFFHDLNGLIASKLYDINLTVLLINNNGGGIFSFLPQSEHPKNFEKLFGTPLDLQFEHSIKMFGGHYEYISDWSHLSTSLSQKLKNKGLNVFEITTNRDENVQEHRELTNAVSREISRFLESECR